MHHLPQSHSMRRFGAPVEMQLLARRHVPLPHCHHLLELHLLCELGMLDWRHLCAHHHLCLGHLCLGHLRRHGLRHAGLRQAFLRSFGLHALPLEFLSFLLAQLSLFSLKNLVLQSSHFCRHLPFSLKLGKLQGVNLLASGQPVLDLCYFTQFLPHLHELFLQCSRWSVALLHWWFLSCWLHLKGRLHLAVCGCKLLRLEL
mmetsp:Transcript_29805/g.79235  ORF Transcript_29805/g.79235 Transcript_29805/m.79235 type:complete len:201 (+) Transcript_29805:790-1392(+)